MTAKPSQSETEFFAREENEKKHVLKEQHKKQMQHKEHEDQKQLHFMKCPKCGEDLKTVRVSFVDIEECPGCGAIVLDKGELEKLKTADGSILKSLVDIFKKES